MTLRKKGKQWELVYRCPGFPNPFTERFPTQEDAKYRMAEIELEKSKGTLKPPVKPEYAQAIKRNKFITVAELMQEYVMLSGVKHWSPRYLQDCNHYIVDYINPFIGDEFVVNLTTHYLDIYLDKLYTSPVKHRAGHKDEKKTISASVLQKVHAFLRGALHQAIKWGYLDSNPAVDCTLPQYEPKVRDVWSEEEAFRAITLCEEPQLAAAIKIAIACSARIGEIVGLQWNCVDFERGVVLINKEMQRCDKEQLRLLQTQGNITIYQEFVPRIKRKTSTLLVLKTPKTKSSVRTVYVGDTVLTALRELQNIQNQWKWKLGPGYQDYNLVFAKENGDPIEPRWLNSRFDRFISEHELKRVVFHSLRHCSTSMKLRISGGDIKAVQGDNGHAEARMVTDVYSRTFDGDRKKLSEALEREFFHRQDRRSNAAAENIHQYIDQNPEFARMLLGMLQSMSNNGQKSAG